MGLAIVLGGTVGWVVMAIVTAIALFVLSRWRPQNEIGDWAGAAAALGFVGTAVAVSILGAYISESGRTVSAATSENYAGLAALYHALVATLTFPLVLGAGLVLVSVVLRRLFSSRWLVITSGCFRYLGQGAIAALFAYPVLWPFIFRKVFF